MCIFVALVRCLPLNVACSRSGRTSKEQSQSGVNAVGGVYATNAVIRISHEKSLNSSRRKRPNTTLHNPLLDRASGRFFWEGV